MATVTVMTADATQTALNGKVSHDELVYNVKDHGAVGDGVADDTAAVQSAINAATKGGVVYLPPGKYLLNGAASLSLSVSGTILRGSGAETTEIVIGATFTGASAISITASNCRVEDLTVQGASTTTTTNPVANAISITGVRRVKVTNCFFWYINGWAVDATASATNASGNPDGTMLEGLSIHQCAGGIHFLGASVSGYAVNSFISNVHILQTGVTTGGSANLDAVKLEDCWDVLATNLLAWTSVGTGSSFHVVGNCAAIFVKNLDGLGPNTGSCVLIEDNVNGSPQNVQLNGGVAQQGVVGMKITGAAVNIHTSTMRFINNSTHAISVEGTGNAIHFHDVFISASGTGAAGNNYDINWSGSATGYVDGARFASPIVAVGVSGVQQSVNIVTPGQNVRFINVAFLGTGANSTNWFSNLPAAVLEAGSGFNFAATPSFTNAATALTAKSNIASQPAAVGNATMTGNVGGNDAFDRYRLYPDGKSNAGPGTAARDTTWGRQGVAQFGTPDSDLVIGLAGKGLKIKEGTNARMGTAVLAAGAVTVNNTSVTANTRIILAHVTPGGTVGALYLAAVTVGTSFQIKSTSTTDTSTVSYILVEAA